ncbi:uncharacterized protein LOC113791012 [Dermatophagoides pteronyssinus]|uniref:Uncharacterized protein LOC113791012 n=1 Tax=Dermatophagoides pteronyssinus TaxID=6956 RepID=A0A6P6XT42_DERPT|nr:uncharacterized protein LOC113791012 [Dermatophagoides pteronyssinus]
MNVRQRKRKCREPKFFDSERSSYLQELYDEYLTTKCPDARKQTLSNLANFAYNPENYGHLISMSIHCLFLQSIDSTDDFIAITSLKGLCNIVWHPIVAKSIGQKESIIKILSSIECRKYLIDFIINGLLLLVIIFKKMNIQIDNDDDDEQIQFRLKRLITMIGNDIKDVRVQNYCHLLMDNDDDK